jgi:hypothetical protein
MAAPRRHTSPSVAFSMIAHRGGEDLAHHDQRDDRDEDRATKS